MIIILTIFFVPLQELLVSEMCSLDGEKCRVPWTVTPSTNLFSARMIMNTLSVSQLPVISDHVEDHKGHPVGLLDKECINLTFRFGY